MALDTQRNWTVSMADDLERVMRSGKRGDMKPNRGDGKDAQAFGRTTVSPVLNKLWTMPPVHLPDEILIQILEYISHQRDAQRTLASCCLLSRQWYDAAVPLLYRCPHLYGRNFDPFVRAICPSINLHVRKSPLSELVKILNMAGLVHQGSKSMTARLLGRTKGSLEEFVAPQASFAMNCFPALSKCYRLRTLDLSLVSESPPLPELFKTAAHLHNLKTFRLPRSSGFGVHHKPDAFSWPPNLEDLSLSGAIDAHFLHGVIAFPQTLRRLTIEHCPLAKGFAVTHLLKTAVRPLTKLDSLKIAHMPRLSGRALDDVLILLPQITKLSVSVDYVTPALFDEGHFHHVKDVLPLVVEEESQCMPLRHNNLQTLELTNSGNPGIEDKISPVDIMIAIDEGTLPKLRQVRVAKSLLWHSTMTASDAESLADVLQEASRHDWEASDWIFADMNARQYANASWKDVAGVWQFDG